MVEIGLHTASHKLLMGDFNYREIDWANGVCSTAPERAPYQFHQATHVECFVVSAVSAFYLWCYSPSASLCLLGLGSSHETQCFIFFLVFDYHTLPGFDYQVLQQTLLLAIYCLPVLYGVGDAGLYPSNKIK